jgi:uncharacterized protein (TIGR00255 family)
MIRSMTAFASAERAAPWGTLACELRAVNHRYLELSLRLPEELRGLEPMLRERIAARVQRGKLELGMRLRSAAGSGDLQLNQPLLRRLSELARDCVGDFPNMQVDFAELLRYPGLIEQAEIDPDALRAEAQGLIDEVLDEFARAREREGENLAKAMRERLDGIAAVAVQVRGWVPEIRQALQERLRVRLLDLKQPVEPGRFEQELVLGLQKIDVDEELDRLDSHVAEARRVLGLREAVGRRLDFLMQEFNREANTLGSKSVDSRTTQAAVELKVLIEQLREQVQNLE